MKITIRRAVGTVVAASALTAGGVTIQQRGCSAQDCAKLLTAVEAACRAEPLGVACVRLRAEWQKSCAIAPTPSPTASPTVEPTATPTAEPTPVPTVEPTPEPTVEPTPTPTPVPTPTPTACQDVEAQLVAGPPCAEEYGDQVLAATTKLGRLGPDCTANLDRLAAQIRADTGLCAFGGGEAVFIRRGEFWEENHACYFGNGSWTNSGRGKFIGCHHVEGSAPPPTAPPPSAACPATPCPERFFEDGSPHWKYKSKPHTMGNRDTTPVLMKSWDYCKAVGLGWMDDAQTIPRGECPVRPDGHPERVPVENWLLGGGPTRDSRNGQDCTPNGTDNPAAILNGTGSCRMCNADKTVCTDWF